MSAKRILPADVYDALEFAALAFGGIGATEFAFDAHGGHVCGDSSMAVAPNCAFGYADWLDCGQCNRDDNASLRAAGISAHLNDKVVEYYNAKRRRRPESRIPFADWCAELGVERGT
jgi:hypothetical protein